MFIYLNFI